MSTELKTDSWCRYMLYRKEDYSKGIFFTREEKRAVEAGSKFTMAAYPDVWARDAGLVKRVRQFLGDNFHWHDRLSKSGSNLEVMQTLRDMVRGGSVVVIPETAVSGAVGSSSRAPTAPARKSFLDLVMEKMGLSHDEATKYIDDYNDRMLRIDAIVAQYQRGKAASRADDGSDADDGGDVLTSDRARPSTPFGDAQPFEYAPSQPGEGAAEIASRVGEEGEADCFSRYQFDLDQCSFGRAMYQSPAYYVECKARAFARYQQCRGY